MTKARRRGRRASRPQLRGQACLRAIRAKTRRCLERPLGPQPGAPLARVAGNVSLQARLITIRFLRILAIPGSPRHAGLNFRSAASSGIAKARLEPSIGSNCRSCRPVPCAPLSSGDQGCQDGQKTARGRHFLRPPFCRITAMVDPAFRAVKSQLASSCCTSQAFGKAEALGENRTRPRPLTRGLKQAA